MIYNKENIEGKPYKKMIKKTSREDKKEKYKGEQKEDRKDIMKSNTV